MALVVTDTNETGCPGVNFNKIRTVADTAWGNYYRDAVSVENISIMPTLNIYPNPAHDRLYIDLLPANNAAISVTFHNVLGQALYIPLHKAGTKYEADISNLPPGLYHVLYRSGEMQATAKFLKQ